MLHWYKYWQLSTIVASPAENLGEEKATARKIKLSERLKQKRINDQIKDSHVMNSTSHAESEVASDQNKYSINVPIGGRFKYKGTYSHRNLERKDTNQATSDASVPQDAKNKDEDCKIALNILKSHT